MHSPQTQASAQQRQKELKGYFLGFLGVAIFSATLPVTKLAVGTDASPLMSGYFVAFARAAIAGTLSLLWLLWVRPASPKGSDWLLLAVTACGVVFGFPLLTSHAMRYVDGTHASVVLGLMPLATAICGALVYRRRPPSTFWLASIAGCGLVMTFTIWRGQGEPGANAMGLSFADVMLLGAVVLGAIGYTSGAALATRHRSETVISWALVISLPLTTIGAWHSAPSAPMPPVAWFALGYVALFSMWIGFFAWYRGLVLGGVMGVSQVQSLQPFLGILVSIPLLGEAWSWVTIAFALAVVVTVYIAKRCLAT
jgi:drug/metabolite transporter (DMT)-like permease